jgi:lysine-N-methylase
MPPEFLVPDGVTFACTQCGDCCRTGNVLLAPGEAERLAMLDWAAAGHAPPDGPHTAAVRTGQRQGERLARRPDGACIFLDSRNRCLLHEVFGPDAKPLLCRLYPFGFHPVGDRVAVDCSFACRSIAEGLGPPIAERHADWERLLDEAVPRAPLTEPPLDERRRLSPALLWELEEALVAFLQRRDLDLFDRLRCGLRFLALATTGRLDAETSGEFRRAMAEGLARKIAAHPPTGTPNATQRALFMQELYAALNPPEFELLGSTDRLRAEDAWLMAGARFRERRGTVLVDGRDTGVPFERLGRVSVAAAEREGAGLLERWYVAAVVGQRFRLAGDAEIPLVEAAARLALRHPMALWSARALAAERGADAAGPDDVRRAVRLLDRTAGRLPLDRLDGRQREALRVVLVESDLLDALVASLRAGTV